MSNAKRKAYAEYRETKVDFTEPTVKRLREEIASTTREMDAFWAKHCHLIEFLPKKYQTADAVVFMLESVKNLRADTLTDVINLYEEELFRRAQLKSTKQIAQMQQQFNEQMLEAMQDIERGQETLQSDLRIVQAMQVYDIITKQ